MATREEVLLAKVTDNFRNAMLEKMLLKRQMGWTGWNSKKKMGSTGQIIQRIIENADSGDWVDVANLAMIAWHLENK